jgi:hypothetical protein
MALNGYTKLSSSILASSIWQECNETRLVWITLLALADANGMVEASVPGLASIARVPLSACEEALRALQAPDPYSRNPDHQGRRIEPVNGGWLLLNHEHYRVSNDPQVRREYLRRKKQESRARELARDKSFVVTTREGFVYYAVVQDRVKIGFSKNPWARIKEQRTAAPSMQLAAIESAQFHQEAERHQQFASLHIEREWFRFEGALREHIERLRINDEAVNYESSTSTTKVQAEAEAEARSYPSDKNGGTDVPADDKKAGDGNAGDVKADDEKADDPPPKKRATHRGHVAGFCDWLCLPTKLRDQFVQTAGEDISTPEARAAVEARVLAWAQWVREKWHGREIGDTIWAFWAARWRERVGSTTATPSVTRHVTMPEAEAAPELTPERAERLRLIRAQVAQEWGQA